MNNTDVAVLATAFVLAMTGVAASGTFTPLSAQATAARAPHSSKPTIVLVHGAFADGTGWQRVIPILQRDGYTVVAAQNALNSLADDVATTQRLIQAQSGPVIVVGHSYGGAIISGAASGQGNVAALVYLAAFAPDAGEPVGAFNATYPSDLGPALVIDAAGFGTIDRAKFRDVFAADVSALDARVMAATQKPASTSTFAASNPTAAWRTIPSWYLVSKQDRAISPTLERFYAQRMGARVTELDASHVAFISRPYDVVRIIEQAARATSTASSDLR
jgi:pimeloyl-ACP methyl ester carboxylesterase